MNTKNKVTGILFQKSQADSASLVLRVGASLLMLTHGIPKLIQLVSAEPVVFAGVMGMSPTLSLALAVFAEVICSVFILFGLGTRLAAVPLVFTMLIAAFHIHASDPFAGKEMALLYALMFIVVTITGGGKYSLDYLLLGKRNPKLASA